MKTAKASQTLSSPGTWRELPWGEHFRQALERQLQPWLRKIFGLHLLKIGNLSAEIDTSTCAISHQVNVSLLGKPQQVKANPLHLPFTARSVDACLMAHILPWCKEPHALLREADRVLIDDGWLILSGFNPLSVIGLAKLLPVKRKHPPYNSRLFTMMRLLDWLLLLNYEVIYQGNALVLPWHWQGGQLLSTHLPALGCMQLIVARKRTVPLTLNPMRARRASAQLRPAVSATRQYREP